MLRLARDREELRVVADQHGAPTWSRAIAAATARIVAAALADPRGPRAHFADRRGVYHLAAAGRTTWHGFAEAILAADPARAEQRCRRVLAIPTADYPTPARRPASSLLDGARAAERLGGRARRLARPARRRARRGRRLRAALGAELPGHPEAVEEPDERVVLRREDAVVRDPGGAEVGARPVEVVQRDEAAGATWGAKFVKSKVHPSFEWSPSMKRRPIARSAPTKSDEKPRRTLILSMTPSSVIRATNWSSRGASPRVPSYSSRLPGSPEASNGSIATTVPDRSPRARQ
jgi:hypothetical protein